MLLPEIRNHKRWKQFSEIYTWLAFISIVLILTNGVASLDKMSGYNPQLLSALMTYGWILLVGLMEALVGAVVIELLVIVVDLVFRVDLTFGVRILLLGGLILALVSMIMIIFIL